MVKDYREMTFKQYIEEARKLGKNVEDDFDFIFKILGDEGFSKEQVNNMKIKEMYGHLGRMADFKAEQAITSITQYARSGRKLSSSQLSFLTQLEKTFEKLERELQSELDKKERESSR